MSLYSICDDCDNTKCCMCFEITIKGGEGSFYIPFKQYERMYCNTKKNKSNTSIIIFKNFDITGKDKKEQFIEMRIVILYILKALKIKKEFI